MAGLDRPERVLKGDGGTTHAVTDADLRLLAGDCTVVFEDSDEIRSERGNTVSIVKPNNCGELLIDQPSLEPLTNRPRFARAKRLCVVLTKVRP